MKFIDAFTADPTAYIDVCPACYEHRDALVPLVLSFRGADTAPLVWRLPGGEKLNALVGSYRVCYHCLWSEEPS